jgi:hypothetical protein
MAYYHKNFHCRYESNKPRKRWRAEVGSQQIGMMTSSTDQRSVPNATQVHRSLSPFHVADSGMAGDFAGDDDDVVKLMPFSRGN